MLAREPGPIDLTMVIDAVTRKIVETSDLDWKRCLPMDGMNPDWKSEFAKDVAAMANSGGGTVIFGVSEDRGTSAATAIIPVTVSDSKLQTLHAVAFNNIHPPVLGMTLTALSDADGENSVLVLEVPDSIGAPHLIYSRDYFGAPIRNGSATAWMTERLLDNAYKLRFGLTSLRSTRLHDLLEQAFPHYATGPSIWAVAAATPSNPRVSAARRATRDEARSIISDARNLRFELAERIGHSPLERISGRNPWMGLRRWIDSSRTPGQIDESTTNSRSSIVEIHDDGSVTLAAILGGFASDSERRPNHVHVEQVEAFVADFVALVGSCARVFSLGGRYDVVLTMRLEGTDPIVIRIPDPQFGYLMDAEYSTNIFNFSNVTTELAAQSSNSMLLTATQSLAMDVVNQGGVQKLYSIR